mgnify:CR=1 FL=1
MNLKRLYALFLVVGGTLILTSCTNKMEMGGQPFITTDPKNLPVSQNQKYVSICYNADKTDRDTIIEIAKKNCLLPGANVRFFSHNLIFNECPVVSKARVTFLCAVPKP